MTWKKIKARSLYIRHERFQWKRGHYELESYEQSKRAEKILIYLDGFYSSPLVLIFKQDDNKLLSGGSQNGRWSISSWLENTGILYFESEDLKSKNSIVNLNKPSIIKKLIKYHRKSIWKPKKTKEPTIVENALLLLDEMENLKDELKTKANRT